jgi:hypothetical protein
MVIVQALLKAIKAVPCGAKVAMPCAWLWVETIVSSCAGPRLPPAVAAWPPTCFSPVQGAITPAKALLRPGVLPAT